METDYKSRHGMSYSSARRRIAQSVSNTLRLLETPSDSMTESVTGNESLSVVDENISLSTIDDGVLDPSTATDSAMLCDVSTVADGYAQCQDEVYSSDDGESSMCGISNDSSDIDMDGDSGFEKPSVPLQLAQWAVRNKITDQNLHWGVCWPS